MTGQSLAHAHKAERLICLVNLTEKPKQHKYQKRVNAKLEMHQSTQCTTACQAQSLAGKEPNAINPASKT